MKIYNQVIVHLDDPYFTLDEIPYSVPCYANFDYNSNPIGVAILKRLSLPSDNYPYVKTRIIADICLFEDKFEGHFPAIGTVTNTSSTNPEQWRGSIISVGICISALDKDIQALSYLSDHYFRIIPKETPLEWGSMGNPIDFLALGQWPKPNHTGNEKPIGKYVDGKIVLNDEEINIGYKEDNPTQPSDTCHHPNQHTFMGGRHICMDCGIELFGGKIGG